MPELTKTDLDELERLAQPASAGPYKVREDPEAGPENPETGEPTPGWWVDGPNWLSAGYDDEFLMFTRADAHYFAALEPDRIRALIALARHGLSALQTAASSKPSDPEG